jgi:hypothetical protein
MKSLKTAARTIGLCVPIALYAAAAAAEPPADRRGNHGQSPSLVEGSGTGTVTAESPNPCSPTQQCQITISGSGAIFGGGPNYGNWGGHGLGNFSLQAALTVAYPDGTPNGFGAECYPVAGSLSLSPNWDNGNALVVDVQGQDCALGSSTTVSTITATYVVDDTQSTGIFAGAAGVGTIGASVDAGQSPPAVQFAFSGSLQVPSGGNGSSRQR